MSKYMNALTSISKHLLIIICIAYNSVANKVITKGVLMNTTCKCKIKTMVYKMSFIKGLFKDEISKGFPDLWEGHGDLYKKSNLLNYDKNTTVNFKT